MSDLKNYKATINGIDHTFLLNDEDARARGLDPSADSIRDEDLVTSPLDFGTPTTDGEQVESNVAADLAAQEAAAKVAADADAKARTAANKARTAADK